MDQADVLEASGKIPEALEQYRAAAQLGNDPPTLLLLPHHHCAGNEAAKRKVEQLEIELKSDDVQSMQLLLEIEKASSEATLISVDFSKMAGGAAREGQQDRRQGASCSPVARCSLISAHKQRISRT